jgi:hypothetical protein
VALSTGVLVPKYPVPLHVRYIRSERKTAHRDIDQPLLSLCEWGILRRASIRRSLALALAHRDDLVGKTERMGVAHMRMYVITDDAC